MPNFVKIRNKEPIKYNCVVESLVLKPTFYDNAVFWFIHTKNEWIKNHDIVFFLSNRMIFWSVKNERTLTTCKIKYVRYILKLLFWFLCSFVYLTLSEPKNTDTYCLNRICNYFLYNSEYVYKHFQLSTFHYQINYFAYIILKFSFNNYVLRRL